MDTFLYFLLGNAVIFATVVIVNTYITARMIDKALKYHPDPPGKTLFEGSTWTIRVADISAVEIASEEMIVVHLVSGAKLMLEKEDKEALLALYNTADLR